jgi:hypothetical protein
MMGIIKKVTVVILTIAIVLSSIGLTIINHICKTEQKVYSTLEEFQNNSKCSHTSKADECCDYQNVTCCSNNALPTNELSYNSGNNCCSDIKFFQKVDISSSERNLKKFSESFVITQKIEYVKESVVSYFQNKFETVKLKIFEPVKKIIKYIKLNTNLLSTPREEALL